MNGRARDVEGWGRAALRMMRPMDFLVGPDKAKADAAVFDLN
jgi:hypothetical protein